MERTLKAPSPAFSFYPKDWLVDGHVREMTHEQRGVYMELLSIYWLEGGLPAEPGRLARLAGVPQKRFLKLWPAIARCFVVRENTLWQKRLEEEKTKQIAFSESQRAKGLKGGKPIRINKDTKLRQSPGLTESKPDESLPSPIPSPSSTPQRQRQEESTRAREPNPLADRHVLISEGNALIREIAPLADLDQTEVLSKASAWNGKSYVRLDTMPEDNDRLIHTVNALRAWLRSLKGEPEPEMPPARASPLLTPSGQPGVVATQHHGLELWSRGRDARRQIERGTVQGGDEEALALPAKPGEKPESG